MSTNDGHMPRVATKSLWESCGYLFFLGCLQPFTAQIRCCAAMLDEAAAACLTDVWEDHC